MSPTFGASSTKEILLPFNEGAATARASIIRRRRALRIEFLKLYYSGIILARIMVSRRQWLESAGKMLITAPLAPRLLAAGAPAWNDGSLFGLDSDPLSRRSLWITDLKLMSPSSAISSEAQRGRWQAVSYEARYKDKELKGNMLLAGPETFAPPLRCELKAPDWHAIYVGMKSFLGHGDTNAIKFKLKDDPCHWLLSQTIGMERSDRDPATRADWIRYQIQDCFFRCADCTGQYLEIAQNTTGIVEPCAIAYIRLVPLSTGEIRLLQQRRKSKGAGRLICMNDAFSFMYERRRTSREEIWEEIFPFRDTAFAAIYWCSARADNCLYPTKVGTVMQAEGIDSRGSVIVTWPKACKYCSPAAWIQWVRRSNSRAAGGVTAKIYKPMADGLYWDDKNRRVFPPDSFDWTAKYLELIGRVEALEKAGGQVKIIRRPGDIETAKRESKAGVILGNEGTLPLGGNAKGLGSLYQRGLRELALFWPAGNHTRHVVQPDGRLTTFAREVIETVNQLGVVLDSSHLAALPAFEEVLKQSKHPVIHTHGAPKFPRSWTLAEGDLEDRQIRAIAESGGVIGLHFCTYIKNQNGWNWSPTPDDLMDHVQHLVRVGGIECVGIGADHFPYNSRPPGRAFQQIGNTFLEDRDWGKTFVVGLENISGMPLFTQALVRRGFSDDQIRKILGLNVLRVLKQVWKA